MRSFLLLLVLFAGTCAQAQLAVVDTISVESRSMNKAISCVVIRPQGIEKMPVLYLLHGYSGNFSNWISKVPELKEWAQKYRIIIVCPDGDYASWYFDSPVDPRSKYETFISMEVPAAVDRLYPTLADRKHRAITGLSMGGHGALFLAFRHAGVFGAAGSMSGGLDLNSIKGKYDISRKLGDTIRMAKNYSELSIINVIDKKPAETLAITFDCGITDGFYQMNKAVHEKMLKLNIAHDYTERPGGHTWEYWENSLKYQLVFFDNFFRLSGSW